MHCSSTFRTTAQALPSPHRGEGGERGERRGRSMNGQSRNTPSSPTFGLAQRPQTTIFDSPRRSPLSALPPMGGGGSTFAPQKVEPTRHEEYICNGFIGIRITVPLFERIHDEQINLGGETERRLMRTREPHRATADSGSSSNRWRKCRWPNRTSPSTLLMQGSSRTKIVHSSLIRRFILTHPRVRCTC